MTSYTLPFLASVAMGLAAFLVSRQFFAFVAFLWKKIRPTEINSNRFWRFLDSLEHSSAFEKLVRKNNFEPSLKTAGLHPSITINRILSLKKVTILASVVVGGLWWLISGVSFLLPALVLLSYTLPDIYLRKLSQKRATFANKTLPTILDLLRMQANMGLNLEQSIENVYKSRKDLWARELGQMNFEINAGVPITEALDKLAARFATEDLRRFSLAIKQAKVLGASVAQTLAIQSEALRTRRRQRAEEQAKLASVKITFPLVIFIFPALLIIYLAPAILQILKIQ